MIFRDTPCWECIADELTKSRDEADATTAYAIRQALKSPIACHRLAELQAGAPERIVRIDRVAHTCRVDKVRCK